MAQKKELPIQLGSPEHFMVEAPSTQVRLGFELLSILIRGIQEDQLQFRCCALASGLSRTASLIQAIIAIPGYLSSTRL